MRNESRNRAKAAIRCVAAVSILTAEICTPVRAIAQPSSATIAGAQVLVGEGRKLRAAGDMKGARDRFQSAYLLVPTPIIGLDLGKAREVLGELVEARAVLLEASKLPPIPNESAESKAARVEAVRIADDLAARIPTLTVSVEGAESGVKLSVSVDGDDVPEADLTKPRPVNPGKHVVVVRMGERVQRTTVDLAEKDAKTASIVFPPIKPPPNPLPNSNDVKPPPPTPHVVRTSPLTYAGFSLAGAGIVVGTVTGIIALGKAHSFATSCEGYNFQCPPELRGSYDSARRYGNVSTVSFIAGGVGLVVGVYGLLTRESSRSVAAAPIAVSVGIGTVGVHGAF